MDQILHLFGQLEQQHLFQKQKNINFIYKNNNVWMSGVFEILFMWIKKTMGLKMIHVGHHTELYSGDDILFSVC